MVNCERDHPVPVCETGRGHPVPVCETARGSPVPVCETVGNFLSVEKSARTKMGNKNNLDGAHVSSMVGLGTAFAT